MPDNPISLPSGYAPAFAIGYADAATGKLAVVDSAKPLPVLVVGAAAPSALSGTLSASTLVGPFRPIAGSPVYLTLSGDWQGRAAVLRSIDGGATRQSLTMGGIEWAAFGANACEPIWEEHVAGADLYLDITIASGTLTYHLAQ